MLVGVPLEKRLPSYVATVQGELMGVMDNNQGKSFLSMAPLLSDFMKKSIFASMKKK